MFSRTGLDEYGESDALGLGAQMSIGLVVAVVALHITDQLPANPHNTTMPSYRIVKMHKRSLTSMTGTLEADIMSFDSLECQPHTRE